MKKIFVKTFNNRTAMSDLNTAVFILQNNGIRLTSINTASLMFKTGNCIVKFIPANTVGSRWLTGRRCDIAFGFPEDISFYMTGQKDGNVPEGKSLVQIIMDIEKDEE